MKVLFIGKDHRQRRKETMLHPPKGIEFIPQQPLKEMKKDHQLTGVKLEKGSIWQRIKDFTKYNNLISGQDLERIDLIYSPGKLIFNKFPWVVEVDNVSCLSYYNLTLLHILKPLIAWKLKSKWCKTIICLSEAGKKSVVNFFNDDVILSKCTTVHPFVSKPLKRKRKDNIVRLLYVSSAFHLKGGRQIIRAFEQLNWRFSNLELVIVSNTPQEVIDDYCQWKNIKFVKPDMEKKELYEKYYTQSDIFLQLSFQDSFNMTVLEAMSCGLPVVATDMFAIPEMVKDGYNGFVLKSPIDYFDDDYQPNPKFWNMDINIFVRYCVPRIPELNEEFLEMESKLVHALDTLVRNKSLRKTMGNNSLRMVKEKFNENKRQEALTKALTKTTTTSWGWD